MRRFGMAGVCLAVGAAFAAFLVPSASAGTLPALFECVKAKTEVVKYEKKGKIVEKTVFTGEYKEKKCKKKDTTDKFRKLGEHPGPEGKYELQEFAKASAPFKGTGKGANLEAEGIGGVSCTGSTVTGKFTGPKTAGDIVATFTGCEFNGRKCASSGAPLGTIVTDPLTGSVGYLEGKGTGSPKVGTDVKPESGEVLGKFACKEEDLAASGSVIGEVSPVNTFTKKATFAFKQKAIGVQQWEKFEEGVKDTLLAGLCEECSNPLEPGSGQVQARASEETTVVGELTTAGEELEVKA